jgi:hypothetical protein
MEAITTWPQAVAVASVAFAAATVNCVFYWSLTRGGDK